jgi:hypothetical protein
MEQVVDHTRLPAVLLQFQVERGVPFPEREGEMMIQHESGEV